MEEPAKGWTEEEKEEWLRFMDRNKKLWDKEDRDKWIRAFRDMKEDEWEARRLINIETKEQWDGGPIPWNKKITPKDLRKYEPYRGSKVGKSEASANATSEMNEGVSELHPKKYDPAFEDAIGSMFRPVLVEWEDAIQSNGRWHPMDELSPGTATCLSVGFYIPATGSKSVVVLPHVIVDSEDAEDQCCGEMVIPRSAIRNMWELGSNGHIELKPEEK